MTTLHFKGVLTNLVIILLIVFLGNASHANPRQPFEEQKNSKISASKQEIHVLADKMITNYSSKFAEFIGNVKVTQGTTTLQTDKMIIYYAKEAPEAPPTTEGTNDSQPQSSIRKIESFGHVRIIFDNKLATADKAVYTAESQKLVLSGHASLSEESDSISGEQIVLDRISGKVTITGDSAKQVEGFFKSGVEGFK